MYKSATNFISRLIPNTIWHGNTGAIFTTTLRVRFNGRSTQPASRSHADLQAIYLLRCSGSV